jgi:hypothetical protein
LNPDLKKHDEVVVVGYGIQKKKLVTGATVNVNGEELQKMSTTNILDALKGQNAWREHFFNICTAWRRL